MSFFSQLKDEVNDKNIDKAKLKELTKTIREEPAEQAEAPQKKKSVQEDPEYPDHPDYIALKPRMTEVKLWNMPAIRFYLTLIFFCVGMILFGIINQVFALGMTKGAVGWWQLLGGAAGFLFSREYVEPRLRIPFSKGTPEQKKKAVEQYLAEIEALDDHIEKLRNLQGVEQSEAEPESQLQVVEKEKTEP